MKPKSGPDPKRELIVEQWWVGLTVLLFWAAVIVAVFLLSSCGGTITLRPDGSLSYTTPEILKATIVPQK